MDYGALGLIEVIGYPPALEAADAALKAANVKLVSITKVDGGIMTVQLMGDVGAISAAVDAGKEAAARVGKVRAAHVIPRVSDMLFDTVLKPISKQTPQQVPTTTTVEEKIEQTEVLEAKAEQLTEQTKELTEEINELSDEIEALQSTSNSGLRKLITDLKIDIQDKKLSTLKKQELIEVLTAYYKAKKGEA